MRKSKNYNSNKFSRLKEYVHGAPYIDVLEQPKICKSFGLPYSAKVFRDEYRNRIYEFFKNETTTAATASKVTKIPHKYICEIKSYLENRDLLKVVTIDRCPTTGSHNVQFISTNKDVWSQFDLLQKTNQFNLFEDGNG